MITIKIAIKNIVQKIIFSIKEQQSSHHTTEKRYCWNHFQNDFFPVLPQAQEFNNNSNIFIDFHYYTTISAIQHST